MKVLSRLSRDVLYVCHLQLPRDKMLCTASCREGEGSRGGELGGAEGEHLCNV